MDIATTLANMGEKLAWAERSIQRMEQASDQKDAVAVQDHFWSFLHASQLLWFYMGRHFEDRGHKAGAKAFVQQWVASQLDATQASTWIAVNELRSADVHIQPVATEVKTDAQLLMRDGKLLMRDGKLLARITTRYLVDVEGKPRECSVVAREWVALAKSLVDHLQLNPP